MELYDIFHSCFPVLPLGAEVFSEITGIGGCDILKYESDGKTVGFAAINGGDLRLICVLPQYRGKGVGSELFRRAEKLAASKGLGELNIGGCGSGLFIGAEIESAGFFEKLGCKLGENIAEMSGEPDILTSVPYPDGASFGFYCGDRNKLRKAVFSVDEEWPQYFGDCEVFCGFSENRLASFCIVEDDVKCLLSDGESRIGSIGCVGTIPEFRRRGIGLKMVSLAAEELKRRGCNKIFIHYTAVYDWYARLGFRTFVWVRLGGKKLQ